MGHCGSRMTGTSESGQQPKGLVWGELNFSIYGRCLSLQRPSSSVPGPKVNKLLPSKPKPYDKKRQACCYKWNFDGSCFRELIPADTCISATSVEMTAGLQTVELQPFLGPGYTRTEDYIISYVYMAPKHLVSIV